MTTEPTTDPLVARLKLRALQRGHRDARRRERDAAEALRALEERQRRAQLPRHLQLAEAARWDRKGQWVVAGIVGLLVLLAFLPASGFPGALNGAIPLWCVFLAGQAAFAHRVRRTPLADTFRALRAYLLQPLRLALMIVIGTVKLVARQILEHLGF